VTEPRTPDAPSDPELLAAFAAGDETATRAFIQRFQARVFGIAVKMLADRDLADDVAQEAFVRAWRKASTFDSGRGTVAAWLMRITHNLAVDELRRRRYDVVEPDALASLGGAAGAPPVDEIAIGSADAAPVFAALQRLPESQRGALVQAAVFGRTAAEIARTEGIPIGTVKTRVRLGLRKLRRELATAEIAPD
jgi:RNA polymerase sigma-70 factor (ECF subfamily)